MEKWSFAGHDQFGEVDIYSFCQLGNEKVSGLQRVGGLCVACLELSYCKSSQTIPVGLWLNNVEQKLYIFDKLVYLCLISMVMNKNY